uniref:G protein-coupled receptor n=1 Tax=Panagrolaimus superbus TaxID=310955 RepID=A0A914Y3Y6_9BILA
MKIFFMALLISDFVSIIAFLLLLAINKRRYRYSSSGFEKHYALSARYQIAENVRTTRLLYPLVLAYLMGSVISIIILYQAGNTLKAETLGSPFQIYLAATNWGQSFDILFALLAIIFPHLAIYGHHSLLREFRKVLTLDHGRRRPRRPKRLNGDPLIMTCTEERNLHFERLEAMWQHSPRRP